MFLNVTVCLLLSDNHSGVLYVRLLGLHVYVGVSGFVPGNFSCSRATIKPRLDEQEQFCIELCCIYY